MKRILFNTSKGAFKDAGGGEMQLLQTKKSLEALGFEVKILEQIGYETDYSNFDLLHNFNIHRDNKEIILKAKKAGLPVAISTIYWPSLKNALLWNHGIGKAKAVAVELINRIDVFGFSSVRKMLNAADLLLPNSHAEAAALESIFSLRPEKIFVVPNGVEKRFFDATPKAFEEKYGLRDFVLFVGRIEERKNVLSLIRAMKGIEEKLVIIGAPTPQSRDYFELCRKEAGKNVVFLEALRHESPLLESAYAACRVFCLPSWYETPGLAALEAGLAGAGLVVTEEGCTKEYFGNGALYVKPASVQDIAEKIRMALEREQSGELQEKILRNFLWGNAAKETGKAYLSVGGALDG